MSSDLDVVALCRILTNLETEDTLVTEGNAIVNYEKRSES